MDQIHPKTHSDKSRRQLSIGCALTAIGALVADAVVILTLGNLLGWWILSTNWLIGLLASAAVLLTTGWWCRKIS